MKMLQMFHKSHASLDQEEIGVDFLDTHHFMLTLVREKHRTDRNLHPFSLILFDIDAGVPESGEKKEELRILAKIVVEHSRLSDAKGWYIHEERRCVGLLINDTPPLEIKRIVDEIRAAFATRNGSSLFTVKIWEYPEPKELETVERFPGAAMEVLDATAADMLKDLCTLPLWKRAIDIVGATILLLAFSWLFLFIALMIKWVSPGPVFFKQKRIGLNEKPFDMYKFRSMHCGADVSVHRDHVKRLIKEQAHGGGDEEVPMEKLNNDQRVIPGGGFIRKTSIDELPQLINVLKGEMSLIGPRPCIPYEAEEYAPWQKKRLHIVPGMTGLWQVRGKNRTTFKQMVRLDIQYIRNLSPWMDLLILTQTPRAVLKEALGSGAKTPAKEPIQKNA